jgi:hypothetical protein
MRLQIGIYRYVKGLIEKYDGHQLTPMGVVNRCRAMSLEPELTEYTLEVVEAVAHHDQDTEETLELPALKLS